MSNRIDRNTFCRVYVPMARKGSTALEIANELGVDKPTDEEKSQFVSQKASNYRKELRVAAETKAKEAGLDKAETKKLVEATTAKLPRLSKQTRTTDRFVDFLNELLAECDADPSEEGEEESTEAPEEGEEESTEAPE